MSFSALRVALPVPPGARTRPTAAATLASVALLLLLTTPTRAQTTAFTNRTSFNAAASSLTTIDFNEEAPEGSYTVYDNATVTLSGVTFTANGVLLAVDNGFPADYGLGDDAVLSYQGANPRILTIALPAGTTAIGMNFGDGSGSPTTFTLSNGSSFTYSSSITPRNTNPTFAGFMSSSPILSLTITSDSFASQIDRVSFGRRSVVAVASPEPSAFALLGAPLMGSLFAARRRKSRRKDPVAA